MPYFLNTCQLWLFDLARQVCRFLCPLLLAFQCTDPITVLELGLLRLHTLQCARKVLIKVKQICQYLRTQETECQENILHVLWINNFQKHTTNIRKAWKYTHDNGGRTLEPPSQHCTGRLIYPRVFVFYEESWKHLFARLLCYSKNSFYYELNYVHSKFSREL